MREIRSRDELILTVNRLMICAMEDIDCGRNEASPTTLDLVQRIEDTDAALRLALDAATKERDEARREAERLMVLVQGWYEGRARIGAHMTFVDQRFYDAVRCQRTGWPGDDADAAPCALRAAVRGDAGGKR